MSLVVLLHDRILYDSLSVKGGLRFFTDKLIRNGNAVAIAVGVHDDAIGVAAALARGDGKWPRLHAGTNVIGVSPRGVMLFQGTKDKGTRYDPIHSVPMYGEALGAWPWYNAYVAEHHDPVVAAELVARYHSEVGGEIRQYMLPTPLQMAPVEQAYYAV